MQPRTVTLLLASIFIASCNLNFGDSVTDDDVGTVPDGGVCKTLKDCKSGNCLGNLCAGSACGPSSKAISSGCDDGWQCVHHPASTDLFGFSSSAFDQCEALCSHCPAHHVCFDGDQFCSADGSWTDPVVTVTATPDHIAPGESVSLQATAVSPIGDTDFEFTWSFNDAEGTSASGSAVTHTYATSNVYHVSVSVDSGEHTRHGGGATLVVVCGNAGDRCSATDSEHDPPCCAGLTCVEMNSFDSFCQ